MKIRGKIFVWIMSTTFIFFLAVVGFLGLNFHKTSIEKAKQLTDAYAEQSANHAKNILDTDMAAVRTVTDIFNDYDELPYEERMRFYQSVMRAVLKANPRFLSIWTSWELSTIREDWLKPYGRLRTLVLRTPGGGFEMKIDTPDIHGDNISGLYFKIKTSGNIEHAVNPYFYTYESQSIKDSILETSLAVHIRKDGVYKGLVGVDVALDDLQSVIQKKLPFDNSFMFLIANNGIIIAHPDNELVGQSIDNLYDNRYNSYKIREQIEEGNTFSVDDLDEDNTVYAYTSFVPIYIGKSKTPWSVAITVPIESVTKEALNNFYFSLIVGILGFSLLVIIIFIVSENITNPLHKTISVLHKLDEGDINVSNKLDIVRKDEMGDMAASLNKLIDTLNLTADFAVNIGRGKLNVEYEALSKRDVLGNALLEMRKNLILAETERQDRILEAERRTWMQEGITEIGDILRVSYDSIEDLSYAVVRTTVKYLKAAQGGMFVEEGAGKNLRYELKAAFAYDKKKKLESEFKPGEGLIGRVAQEQKFLQITEVPEGYTFITSGLGEETPGVLAVMPLLHEDRTFGVIEIAGFKVFEEYQIDFLRTIGQRIASVISNIRASIETKNLLAQFSEQSQQLAEKELEALQTKNELKRAKQENTVLNNILQGVENAIGETGYIAYFDANGHLTKINRSGREIFGLGKDISEVTFADMHSETGHNKQWVRSFWQGVKKGNISKKESSLMLNNKLARFTETYYPVINAQNEIETVICIGTDISPSPDS